MWRTTYVRGEGEVHFRRHPVRFETLDDLAHFCNALQTRAAHGHGPLTLNCDNEAVSGPDFRDVVDPLARVAPAARRQLYITAGPGWALTLRTEGAGAVKFTMPPVAPDDDGLKAIEETLAHLERAIAENARPYRRKDRRRRAPLFEPISTRDALQHKRDLEIARASARRGAVWGALTGLLAGAAVALLTAYFTMLLST